MKTPRQHRFYGISALALFAAALVALGGGDTADASLRGADALQVPQDTTRAEMAEEVEITLSDFAIETDEESIPAGEVTFLVQNAGSVPHSLEIEGESLEQKLEAEIEPGSEATLSVELPPGTYTMYCPLEDHRERGMTLELTVTPRPEPTTGGPSR